MVSILFRKLFDLSREVVSRLPRQDRRGNNEIMKQYKLRISKKDYHTIIEEDLHAEAKKLAKSFGMTFSGLVRYLLMREIQKSK